MKIIEIEFYYFNVVLREEETLRLDVDYSKYEDDEHLDQAMQADAYSWITSTVGWRYIKKWGWRRV